MRDSGLRRTVKAMLNVQYCWRPITRCGFFMEARIHPFPFYLDCIARMAHQHSRAASRARLPRVHTTATTPLYMR